MFHGFACNCLLHLELNWGFVFSIFCLVNTNMWSSSLVSHCLQHYFLIILFESMFSTLQVTFTLSFTVMRRCCVSVDPFWHCNWEQGLHVVCANQYLSAWWANDLKLGKTCCYLHVALKITRLCDVLCIYGSISMLWSSLQAPVHGEQIWHQFQEDVCLWIHFNTYNTSLRDSKYKINFENPALFESFSSFPLSKHQEYVLCPWINLNTAVGRSLAMISL